MGGIEQEKNIEGVTGVERERKMNIGRSALYLHTLL